MRWILERLLPMIAASALAPAAAGIPHGTRDRDAKQFIGPLRDAVPWIRKVWELS